MKILLLLLTSVLLLAADIADLEISKLNQLKQINTVKQEIKIMEYRNQVDGSYTKRILVKKELLKELMIKYEATLKKIKEQ